MRAAARRLRTAAWQACCRGCSTYKVAITDGTLVLWGKLQWVVPMDTTEPTEDWPGEVSYRPRWSLSESSLDSENIFLFESRTD